MSPDSLSFPFWSNTDIPTLFKAFSTCPVSQPSASLPTCKSAKRPNIVLKDVPITSGASLVTVDTVAIIPPSWSILTPAFAACDATLDIAVAISSKSEPVAAPTAANLSVTSIALLASN